MQPRFFIGLTLLGAYLNMIAFGFRYGLGNHATQLPFVNWLINPALYPDDLVPRAYARYPTFYWLGIAYASRWFDAQHLVFASFIVTKILFFAAMTRLVGQFLNDYRLIACIIGSIALSPLLNGSTPFASTLVLSSIQTHTELASAILIWAGCLLVERRWLVSGILFGLSVYINILFATYTLFAFIGFILLDWQQHKREICITLALMVIVGLPWLVLSRGVLQGQFPEDYVEALLTQIPFHLTLRSHGVYDLLRGIGILAAAASMIINAAKLGIARAYRLEALAGFFVIPVVLGALVGEIFPSPSLIRAQFLRADSFLVLYAIILVQVYGGRMLLSMHTGSPATTLPLGMSAILFPLFLPTSVFPFSLLVNGFILIILLGVMTGHFVYLGVVGLLTTGLTAARLFGLTWVPGKLTVGLALICSLCGAWQLALRSISPKPMPLATVIKGFFSYWNSAGSSRSLQSIQRALIHSSCGLVLICAMIGVIPSPSRLWHPIVGPTPFLTAWYEIQYWAKNNTPLDTKFLVPPFPDGFRIFSERTSWVDWKDGDAILNLPEYASEWKRRMQALGIQLVVGDLNPSIMIQEYKQQSFGHLETVAREHNINYIIQYTDVEYHIAPTFRNEKFAAYKVSSN